MHGLNKIMGPSAVLIGDSGSGSVTKLANQIIVNNNTIAIVSEAFVLATKAEADPVKVYEAIRGGLAGSSVLDAKVPMMVERNFVPEGKISINHKDIKNVVNTAHALDDIAVYTNWSKDSIRKGFAEKNKLFYILINSRGFTAAQTEIAHREIPSVVDEVSKETGMEYIFISRSDSTLRGHYPLETVILKEEYEKNTGKKIDGEILCRFSKRSDAIRLMMCTM